MNIAFLILAHNQIELVYKKIEVLNYPGHHFFVHLDKKYEPVIKNEYLISENVHFLNDRRNVNWGGFNIVRATLDLIQEAMNAKTEFDYFILMSGQCFPIKSNAYIQNFLKERDGLSFIEFTPLPDARFKNGGLDKLHYPVFFDQLSFIPDTIKVKHISYNLKKFLFRLERRLLKKIGYKRRILGGITPCFGSQWWVLHKDAVSYVHKYIKEHMEIYKFFKYTWAPDELFFQTVLYNSPLLKDIENRSLWYIDWRTNGPPKTLSLEDISPLRQTDALFARKFDCKINNIINEIGIEK